MSKEINKIVTKVTEYIYPKRCPGCDELLKRGEKQAGFCRNCAKDISLTGSQVCMKCGSPIKNGQAEYCASCAGRVHKFRQSKAVYKYQGPMKQAMYRFKYSNRRCYARIFAKHAIMSHRDFFEKSGVEAIIPVPMYAKKQKKRGYNQAEVFARALGRELDLPVYSDIVRRDKNTVPMKQLNPIERRENLQNAFKLSENVVIFRKVLLIDDIYTTGATMDAVAEVLLSQGVGEVYSYCICVGEN